MSWKDRKAVQPAQEPPRIDYSEEDLAMEIMLHRLKLVTVEDPEFIKAIVRKSKALARVAWTEWKGEGSDGEDPFR